MIAGSHPRFTTISALGVALAVLASATTAFAAPKDAQAQKAISEALGTDYLEMSFDVADQKLLKALYECGDTGCSPTVKAQLHIAIGTVLAGGKKELDDARDSFVEALKIDPNIQPDPDLMSTEITTVYGQARAQLKLGPPGTVASPPAGAALVHKPIVEQRLQTPVPIYAEIPVEVVGTTKKVTVSILPPGAGEWRTLVLKKLKDKDTIFGINISCAQITQEGTLRYHLTAHDESGAVLATAGSRKEPFKTEIKKTISGPAPRWPGFAPPEPCDQGAGTDKPLECLDDKQCNEGLACISGTCRPASEKPEPPPAAAGTRKNWITVSFVPDISFVSGEDVCSLKGQNDENWVCLEDGKRYKGETQPGNANNVNLGPSLATLRVTLGYDRVIIPNLTAGVRVGYAFRGTPGGDTEASFIPVHAELRGTYWIGKDPFDNKGVRPFVFLAGGFAQIDTQVDVQARDLGADRAVQPEPCNDESAVPCDDRTVDLEAYKQTGNGFAGLGVGVGYAPVDFVAMNLAVRASVAFPTVAFVLSPEIGVSFGF